MSLVRIRRLVVQGLVEYEKGVMPSSRIRLCFGPDPVSQWVLRVMFLWLVASSGHAALPILTNYLHLGDSVENNWPGVQPKPQGTNLLALFEISDPVESTLRLKQRDIHGVWRIRLNGREIAQLYRQTAERVAYYAVPKEAVRSGRNELSIHPDNATDDIAVGLIEWIPKSLRTHRQLHPLKIRVREDGSGLPLPARIHVVSMQGEEADLYYCEGQDRAVRKGLIYTRGAETKLELSAGTYRVSAMRGMEWSRAEQVVLVGGGESPVPEVDLRLIREVQTPGYVACDTHLHTYEVSGHGNATLAERVVGLAGEGVELAIATDHNHHVDYRPYQSKLSLNVFFTSVTGNEVTSDNGHFNAFPMDPMGSVPVWKETNWVKLVEGIRAKGAKVVILNHPRWPDMPRNPFTKAGMNRSSGDRAQGQVFPFDAMELVNSTALQKDPMYLFTDWFALLNRGERITAVGSSDTHSVEDPAGQGRTYVPSSTDDPARIDVDEACQAFLKGTVSVSLGIFVEARVYGRFGMGSLAPVRGGNITASVRVAAPGWIAPRRVKAFLNGVMVSEQSIIAQPGNALDREFSFRIRARDYDSHLVFVVIGDGVTHPGWKTYENYTLAATNPIYLDADGDGRYASPREEALARLGRVSPVLGEVKKLIQSTDPALAVQIATNARGRLRASEVESLREWMESKAKDHELFGLYVRHLPGATP